MNNHKNNNHLLYLTIWCRRNMCFLKVCSPTPLIFYGVQTVSKSNISWYSGCGSALLLYLGVFLSFTYLHFETPWCQQLKFRIIVIYSLCLLSLTFYLHKIFLVWITCSVFHRLWNPDAALIYDLEVISKHIYWFTSLVCFTRVYELFLWSCEWG